MVFNERQTKLELLGVPSYTPLALTLNRWTKLLEGVGVLKQRVKCGERHLMACEVTSSSAYTKQRGEIVNWVKLKDSIVKCQIRQFAPENGLLNLTFSLSFPKWSSICAYSEIPQVCRTWEETFGWRGGVTFPPWFNETAEKNMMEARKGFLLLCRAQPQTEEDNGEHVEKAGAVWPDGRWESLLTMKRWRYKRMSTGSCANQMTPLGICMYCWPHKQSRFLKNKKITLEIISKNTVWKNPHSAKSSFQYFSLDSYCEFLKSLFWLHNHLPMTKRCLHQCVQPEYWFKYIYLWWKRLKWVVLLFK